MVSRRRVKLKIEPQAQRDLDELQARNPAATGWAIAAIHAAMARPQALEPKSKRLLGQWAVDFPVSADDKGNSGRVVVDFDGKTLSVVAVDDDHDRAYAKAKARTKPKKA